MTGEEQLPTRQELFQRADAEMAAAREQVLAAEAWLRADWRPLDAALTDKQADARMQLHQLCVEIRGRMDHAHQVLVEAAEVTDKSGK